MQGWRIGFGGGFYQGNIILGDNLLTSLETYWFSFFMDTSKNNNEYCQNLEERDKNIHWLIAIICQALFQVLRKQRMDDDPAILVWEMDNMIITYEQTIILIIVNAME